MAVDEKAKVEISCNLNYEEKNMFLVNTSTKKFTESASLDLGLLPADGKIDIQLTDGSEPVVAEGKTFTMTIGTIEPTLYKTDDDTVSFRYIHFDDTNVSTTLAISLFMDGVEVLDDTISLTYTEAGGGDPFPQGGLVGDFLQKTATGQTWAEVPAQQQADWGQTSSSAPDFIKNKPSIIEAPATAGTAGQVLTMGSSSPEWADVPTELPVATSSDSGKVLTVDSSGSPEWAEAQGGGGTDGNPDYLNIMLSAAGNITFNATGSPDEISLEYSFDKETWSPVIVGTSITVAKAWQNCYFRGNNNAFSKDESNYYKFKFTQTPYISGNIMSLLDKTCESKTIPNNYCFYKLFVYVMGGSKIFTISGLKFPATELTNYCYASMFEGQSSMKGDDILLPALELKNHCYDSMFYGCSEIAGSFILPAVVPVTACYQNMFLNCSKIPYIFCGLYNIWSEFCSNWLQNTGSSASNPTFVLRTSHNGSSPAEDNSGIPSRWIRKYSDIPVGITTNTTTVATSSSATYEVSPTALKTPVLTVASALTLSATAIDSGSVAYAEVVLDIEAGATVTAGTNLTLVDTPTAGKRNVCVVRWSGGVAKLYVTIVEDLPQA